MRLRAVLALLAAAAAPAQGPAALTVALPDAPVTEPARRLLLQPYADATETTLAEPPWDGTQAGLKAAGADIALLRAPLLAAACAAGLLEKIDWDRLVRERFVAGAASDCGLPVGVAATALAWDRDRVPGTPGWGDFWDVAKHPGRRGLQRAARGTLEIALLADGVNPNDVYRTLRTAEGVDRAFRKLDQLKPYVEWWDKPSQPVQYLAAGRALMVSVPAETLATAPAGKTPRHFAVNWSGSLNEPVSLAVLHGAAHAEAAVAALVIASDLARQALFAEASGLGPGNRDAVDLLPDAARQASPSLPQNLQGGLTLDEGFWGENGAKLEARFAQWLGK